MIIIIPGWMHTSSDWQQVKTRLEKNGQTVTVLDIPSFGKSSSVEKLKTFDDTVVWCKTAISKLSLNTKEQIYLVGHSYGGRIALRLVAEGQPVEKLLLSGSPNLYRPSLATIIIKRIVSFLKPIKSFIPIAVRRKLRSADYERAKGTELEKLFLDVIKDDQSELLDEVSVDTILIWGENDEEAPVWIAQELHNKLRKSHLEIIPNVGHNIHIAKPHLLAAKINSYVTKENN